MFCSPLTLSHEIKYVTLLNHFCFYERFIYYAWFGNAACNLGCEQVIEKPSPAERQDVKTSIVTWRNQFRRPKESRFSGFGWIFKLAMLVHVLDWVTCPPLATSLIWNQKSFSSPCSFHLLFHHLYACTLSSLFASWTLSSFMHCRGKWQKFGYLGVHKFLSLRKSAKFDISRTVVDKCRLYPVGLHLFLRKCFSDL